MESAIVGLPYVGKTTLFNLLTGGHAATGGFAGAEGAVNVGVAKVPDDRVDRLAALFKPKKTTHAEVRYADVGLARSAHGTPQGSGKADGAGAQRLGELRNADALVHVVRAFRDPSVPHVEGDVDPARDAAALELELLVADLAVVERRVERIAPELRSARATERDAKEREAALLERVRVALGAGTPVRDLGLAAEDAKVLRGYRLLSEKPELVVVNLDEADLARAEEIVAQVRASLATRAGTAVTAVCAKIEAEVAELPPTDASAFRAELGLSEPPLDRTACCRPCARRCCPRRISAATSRPSRGGRRARRSSSRAASVARRCSATDARRASRRSAPSASSTRPAPATRSRPDSSSRSTRDRSGTRRCGSRTASHRSASKGSRPTVSRIARASTRACERASGCPEAQAVHRSGAMATRAQKIAHEPSPAKRAALILGPGFITGVADDDPSGIGTYAIAGASLGLATLWTALLSFPLMAAVQNVCARLGLIAGDGLAGILRRYYPRPVLYGAVLLVLVANTINLGADLAAIGDAFGIITGIHGVWLVVVIAVGILAVQIFASYRHIERIFKYLTLALFAYVADAILVRPDLGATLRATLVPTVSMDGAYVTTLVAILGTTISPYLFFWQASQEVEEEKEEGKRSLSQRRGGARAPPPLPPPPVNLRLLLSPP